MFVNIGHAGHTGNTALLYTVLSIKTPTQFKIRLLDWIFNLEKVQAVLRQTNKMFRLSRLLIVQSLLRFAHASALYEYCKIS